MPKVPINLINSPITNRRLISLAFPIMISMLSYTAMSVVDTIFIGHLGTVPLAGIGLASTLIFFVHSFGRGLLSGAKVSISQHIGAGDHKNAKSIAWQSVWLALGLGTIVALTGLIPEGCFLLFGISPEIAEQAYLYFSVRVLGAPIGLLLFALNSWFQGTGDMKTPMKATLIANGVNILCDPLLIFGWGPIPAFGIAGAAMATLIGLLLGMLWVVVHAYPDLIHSCRKLNKGNLEKIWVLGLPIAVRYILEVGSYVIFSMMLAQIGAVELAAHVIVVRITSVSFLPGYAISDAAGIIVGQAVGASQPQIVRKVWKKACHCALVFMTLCGVVFWIYPAPLLGVFGADSETLRIGTSLLLIGAAFQLFDAIAMVTLLTLNGAGDTRFTLWISVAATWLIKLPVGYLLAVQFGLGAIGAWCGLFLEIIVLSVGCYWRFTSKKWLEDRIEVPVDRQLAK